MIHLNFATKYSQVRSRLPLVVSCVTIAAVLLLGACRSGETVGEVFKISPTHGLTATLPPTSTATPTEAHPPRSSSMDYLLAALDGSVALERDAWLAFDYGSFRRASSGDFLTSPEAQSLFRFSQAILEQSHPDGFPGAAAGAIGTALAAGRWAGEIWFPPRVIWDIWAAGLVDALNLEGVRLVGGDSIVLSTPGVRDFTLVPQRLGGTWGGEAGAAQNWLVQITSERFNVHGWLPVVDGGAPRYSILPNHLTYENSIRGEHARLILMRAAGAEDRLGVLVAFGGEGSASGLTAGPTASTETGTGYLAFHAWREGKLALVHWLELGPDDRLVEVSDIAVTVATARTLNFGCDWEQRRTYRWLLDPATDVLVLHEETAHEPGPVDCLAAAAIFPALGAAGYSHVGAIPLPAFDGGVHPASLDARQRGELLEKALEGGLREGQANEFDAAGQGDPELVLLWRVHLAAALAVQGQDEAAFRLLEKAIGDIQAAMPESMLGKLVGESFKLSPTPGQSPGAIFLHFCGSLAEKGSQIGLEFSSTPVSGYFSPSALFRAYGNIPSYGPLLCPLDQVVRDQLAGLELPVGTNPVETLTALGFPLLASDHLQADGLDAWLILLDLEQPRPLLVRQDVGEQGTLRSDLWETTLLDPLPGATAAFAGRVFFAPGDPLAPHLLLGVEPDAVWEYSPLFAPCTQVGGVGEDFKSSPTMYWLYDLSGNPPTLLQSAIQCTRLPDLAALDAPALTALATPFAPRYPSPTDTRAFQRYLANLDGRVLSSANPASDLETLDLLLSDPAVPPDYTPHLLFLVMWLCTTTGDEACAEGAYAELVHGMPGAAPDSPWADLAQSWWLE